MRVQEPRWMRFARAAVGEHEPAPRRSAVERVRERGRALQNRVAMAHEARAGQVERRRVDVRLVPAAAATWGSAVIAAALPGRIAGPVLVAWAVLFFTSLCMAVAVRRRRELAAAAPTALFAAACVLAVLLSVALRGWVASSLPLEQAVEQGGDLVLTLEVGTAPRRLSAGYGQEQVAFDARVVQAAAHGRSMTGSVNVQVVAGPEWKGLQPGDRATTAGAVHDGGAGGSGAGVLRPSTVPQNIAPATGGRSRAVAAVRGSWTASVGAVWAGRSDDVDGLLPGMVMGQRDGLDPELEAAMKTVGLTHLTAVSGANCSLVLAALLLLLRSLRAPRSLAVTGSLAGLAGFVLVVGPDPSVLRAAVMGAIGAMAVVGGRPRRVGALLSASIVVLLLVDPWLATDYAFILSVLATLGLHLVGHRCAMWLAALLPLWLAQAVAIPLAAQLFCAPVIVLLQARFTPYTIPANMLAAPVVVIVTTVGTLGLAVAVVAPPLAAFCAGISGVGSWWVAVVARMMAALPGASLPWPGGAQGVVLMALLNAAVLAALAAMVERERAAAATAWVLARVPAHWRRHGFGLAVLLAAAAAAWWSAAVLQM